MTDTHGGRADDTTGDEAKPRTKAFSTAGRPRFDRDNLPDEFTTAHVGRMTFDDFRWLQTEADLTPGQRETLDTAWAEHWKPFADWLRPYAERISELARQVARSSLASLQVEPIKLPRVSPRIGKKIHLSSPLTVRSDFPEISPPLPFEDPRPDAPKRESAMDLIRQIEYDIEPAKPVGPPAESLAEQKQLLADMVANTEIIARTAVAEQIEARKNEARSERRYQGQFRLTMLAIAVGFMSMIASGLALEGITRWFVIGGAGFFAVLGGYVLYHGPTGDAVERNDPPAPAVSDGTDHGPGAHDTNDTDDDVGQITSD